METLCLGTLSSFGTCEQRLRGGNKQRNVCSTVICAEGKTCTSNDHCLLFISSWNQLECKSA